MSADVLRALGQVADLLDAEAQANDDGEVYMDATVYRAAARVVRAHHDALVTEIDVAALRRLAQRCHNGAPDPWQELYDLGASPLLDRIADTIERSTT